MKVWGQGDLSTLTCRRHEGSVVAARGGERALAAKEVLDHGTGLDVVVLVVDLGGDGQVVELPLHPEKGGRHANQHHVISTQLPPRFED